MNAQVAIIQDETQAPTAASSASIISVIERAAMNPDVDIDKMERLLEMHERITGREAMASFAQAMSDAQSEVRPVAADANNPQTKSKYATYGALDKAVRPIYVKHGFALSFNTSPDAPADHLRVICKVMHRAGHTEVYSVDMPSDGKGAKGGDVMTKTHAAGSAMSYGQRYLLKLIFNIAVGDDDDGNRASGPVVTMDQMDEIVALMDEVGADRNRFLRFLRVDSIASLPASRFAEAIRALEAKRAK